MRLSLALICAGALAAAAAVAQQQISPDDVLDRADQRTLTFELFPYGGLVGVEQFLSRRRTVWATPTGTCTYGQIEIRGPQLCFIYRDLADPEHCWTPFDVDGVMVFVSSDFDRQQVTAITTRPVVCEDAPLS